MGQKLDGLSLPCQEFETEQDLLSEEWQEKYRAYSSLRLFPKHNLDCLQATRQMLAWLDSNF